MNKYEILTCQQFKVLLEDIYLIGQHSESLKTSDIIRIVENKIRILKGVKCSKTPSQ